MTQKDFAKQIDAFAQRHPFTISAKGVLDDVAQLTFNAMFADPLLGRVFPRAAIGVKPEALGGLERYRAHPEALRTLGALADDLHQLLIDAEPFTDVVGHVCAGSVAPSRAKALGQFLTPPGLAGATLAHVELRQPSAERPFRMGDLTGCGTGAMALATLARLSREHGRGCLRHVHVLLNDLDPGMAKLAAVQIGMSAVLHRIPLGSLEVHCTDVIAGYLEGGTMIMKLIPVFTPQTEAS